MKLPALIQDRIIRHTANAFLQTDQIYLLLKFKRISPVVIPFQQCNIFTAAMSLGSCLISTHLPDIFMPPKNTNLIRVSFLILKADFPCSILRAIFTNDYFILKVRYLLQYPIKTFPNVLFLIICNYPHRN